MGCGCKNTSEYAITNKSFSFLPKKDFSEKLQEVLIRKNKFSIIGVFLFFIMTPIILAFMVPIVVIFLFNKLIFGKDTNPIDLIVFPKDKSYKNFKKIKK